MITDPEKAKEIVEAWLSTEFKGSAPANKNEGWSDDIKAFLTNAIPDIAKLKKEQASGYEVPCPVCVMASEEKYVPVEGVKGASWIEVRHKPTRAYVKFPAGKCKENSSNFTNKW